jgi:hypothetical protein
MVNHSQGFFAVKKKGIVIAQGWVWLDTNDTLVIDNIEFSNDRDCSEIFPILNKWLSTVKYPNIQLGLGYVEDSKLNNLTPVTETEMFWYKECNYLQPKSIYSDAKIRVWLKKDGDNLLYNKPYAEDYFEEEEHYFEDLPFGYENYR